MGHLFRDSEYVDFNLGEVKATPMEFAQKVSAPWSRDEVIHYFDMRVNVWLLSPAVQVLKAIEAHQHPSAWSHSTYGLLSISTSYFEMIGKVLNPKSAPSGTAKADFTAGFNDVYSDESYYPEEVEEYWNRLRNGLYHIAATKSKLWIHNCPELSSRDFEILWRPDNSSGTSDITPYFYVNPHTMVQTIVEHFPSYIARIRQPLKNFEWMPDKFDEFIRWTDDEDKPPKGKRKMVQFMVIEKDERSSKGWKGHGQRGFRVAPRVGEHITFNDKGGTGQAYEVIAVIHPAETIQTAGDLIVRHVSTDLGFRESL